MQYGWTEAEESGAPVAKASAAPADFDDIIRISKRSRKSVRAITVHPWPLCRALLDRHHANLKAPLTSILFPVTYTSAKTPIRSGSGEHATLICPKNFKGASSAFY